MTKKFKKVPKRLKVVVTKKDIKKGIPGDADRCPIAQAVQREYGDDPTVTGLLYLDIAGERAIYRLPEKAKNFIYKFDDDKKVKPFSFTARLY